MLLVVVGVGGGGGGGGGGNIPQLNTLGVSPSMHDGLYMLPDSIG